MACRLLLNPVLSRLTQVRFGTMTKKKRYFSSSPTVWGHFQQKGIPGSNLPVDINNRYKLTILFIIFFGTGFNAPLLVLLHQISKK